MKVFCIWNTFIKCFAHLCEISILIQKFLFLLTDTYFNNGIKIQYTILLYACINSFSGRWDKGLLQFSSSHMRLHVRKIDLLFKQIKLIVRHRYFLKNAFGLFSFFCIIHDAVVNKMGATYLCYWCRRCFLCIITNALYSLCVVQDVLSSDCHTHSLFCKFVQYDNWNCVLLRAQVHCTSRCTQKYIYEENYNLCVSK